MKLIQTALALLLCAAPGFAQGPAQGEQEHFEGDGHDHGAEGFDHGAHAATAGTEENLNKRRDEPWTDGILDLAESLPIQEGGRIKPLSTYAAYMLLRINGFRKVKLEDGTQLTPTEWLLDTLFFPTQASEYPIFLVQNRSVLDAIGVDHSAKKNRGRYSLQELQPGLAKLMELAREYHPIDQRDRSAVQEGVVTLANNVYGYLGIISRPEALALVPPEDPEDVEWTSVAEDVDSFKAFAEMVYARGDMAEFEDKLGAFHQSTVTRATDRGEYKAIPTELLYYRSKAVARSLYLFVAAFFVCAFLWLKPKSKLLHTGAVSLVVGGTALLIFGIVLRCIILARPPVATLYETILYVVAVGSIVAVGAELINRQRIAVSMAAFMGMIGMFIANGFEKLDGGDTMEPLVAVLMSNFWLGTHVTAITAGYSAGMLAAFLGSVYLICKLLRIRSGDRRFYKTIARMVYGVTCFGLLFSLFGTIWGGVWANDSWGRFWGWDPKENGALLICLSQIALLHGRMGGYLKDHGVCMAAAFGGTVVAFSWWHVNQLGVGLHSYGFTSGILKALWIYYGIQWGIVALGGIAALADRPGARTPTASAVATPASQN